MLDFTPYLDWINVPDPKNPPPGAKEVTAEDLLRYERALAAIAQEAADGLVGDSAYEVAVAEGFAGTKAEWLDSLKGLDGVNAVENDAAVASYINNLTSEVRAALNATYAPYEYVNTVAFGTELEVADAVTSSWVGDLDTETGAKLDARYRADDTPIVLTPDQWSAIANNPSLGGAPALRRRAWLMDKSTVERLQAYVFIPTTWSTIRATVVYANAGTGAGDVTWATGMLGMEDGADASDLGAADAEGISTVGGQWVIKHFSLPTIQSFTAGALNHIFFDRNADNPEDTLDNDAAFYALILEKEA